MQVLLVVDGRDRPAGLVRELAAVFRRHPGNQPVRVRVLTSAGPKLLDLGVRVDAFDPGLRRGVEPLVDSYELE